MATPKKDNLDPNFKRAWIKALRSGKYKQGKSYLKSDNGFCCLGVMKEVCEGVRKHPSSELLSQRSCGLTKETQNFLAERNDDVLSPWGFKRIATWIEKNL